MGETDVNTVNAIKSERGIFESGRKSGQKMVGKVGARKEVGNGKAYRKRSGKPFQCEEGNERKKTEKKNETKRTCERDKVVA